MTLLQNGISLQTGRNHQSNRCQRRQIEKIKNTTAVSFFFLFSAPALLVVRGSPLTARSFARRSFDRSKNTRKRKRLLAVYKNTGHVVKTTTKRCQKIIMLTSLIVGTTFTILVLRQNDKGQEYSKHCQQKIIKQQQFKIHQTETSEMPGTQLAVEIMYMSYHSIYL